MQANSCQIDDRARGSCCSNAGMNDIHDDRRGRTNGAGHKPPRAAEYLYHVIDRALHSDKRFSDGGGQIGAFHLAKAHLWTREQRGPPLHCGGSSIPRCGWRSVSLAPVTEQDTAVAVQPARHDGRQASSMQHMLLGRKTAPERAFVPELDRRLPATGVKALPMSSATSPTNSG